MSSHFDLAPTTYAAPTYPSLPDLSTTTGAFELGKYAGAGTLTTFTGSNQFSQVYPSTTALTAYSGHGQYPTVGALNTYTGSVGSYPNLGLGDTFLEDPSLRVVGERLVQVRVPVFERVQSAAMISAPQIVERPVPVPVPQLQYVDKPVYVDRPVEKIVYVDKPVERIVYVDRHVPAPVPEPQRAAGVAVRQTWNVNDAQLARKMDMEDGVIDGKRSGVAINCAGYDVKAQGTWEVSDARMARVLDGQDGISDGRTSDGSQIKISRDGRVDGIA